MAKRKANGEGTIFQRKDKRWSAQTYVTLANGERKRICITKKSRDAVKEKLDEIVTQNNRLPFSEKDWTIAGYLDYWLECVQSERIRETTLSTYKLAIKNHIKPTLGNHKLRNLSVRDVRAAMDTLKSRGCKGSTQQKSLQILSGCLNCAMREDLIYRNVAQLVEKPKYTPKETKIWTAEQAAHFLHISKGHPYYIAFLLLLTYGMRRGEALGLRWCDIDFDNKLIYLRQQIDRINGKIMARELKTANSCRTLPLVTSIHTTLLKHAAKNHVTPSQFDPCFTLSVEGTVVTSSTDKPIEPRNLARCFHRLSKDAGLPRIKIHAMRHTAATVLKDLNVPIKDAQLILGHANISTTLNIYQHGTPEVHRTAISAVEERLHGRSLVHLSA